MIPELTTLMDVTGPSATLLDYRRVVEVDNALAKPSLNARRDTLSYLRDRYGLDSTIPLFRTMRSLWDYDTAAQPLLAMLLATARDPVLRVGAGVVSGLSTGETVTWHRFEPPIREAFAQEGSEASIRIMAERQPACWLQSGHLRQETPSRRVRGRATSRPTVVAYALWLGHLTGLGGDELFTSFWVSLLDATPELVNEQAREAGRQGLIDLRRGGGVTSVGFRHLNGNIVGATA